MTESLIQFDRVSLLRTGRAVVSDVSFSIDAGEFIGIFGANGAGKTSLLYALLGLIEPAKGQIKVLGRSPRRGHPEIGYLPQQRAAVNDLQLRGWDFVASAFDGTRLGLPSFGSRVRDEVARAIALVEAETIIDRRLNQLSGGEVQRLVIAQAILGRPKLLLLDEPLVNLDLHYQRAMVELAQKIQRELGATVLFTAHEINPLVGAMTRVLYLGQGRAELGTVDEVVTTEVLSRLYGERVDVVRIRNRIVVVPSNGTLETEAHRHQHDHDGAH